MIMKLEPCPFCGKVPMNLERDNDTEAKYYSYRIRCKKCQIPTVRRRTASGAARAWNRRLLITALALLVNVQLASAEVIRVRFQQVVDTEAVSAEYLDSVKWAVKKAYSDIGVKLRISRRQDSRVSHASFRALDQRYSEHEAWGKVLRQKPRWLRIVILPPYWQDGRSYGAGLASWFATVVVRQTERATGADRFNSDWVSVAHELAHVRAYDIGKFCGHIDTEPNIMHSNAMYYADQGIGFLEKTKYCLKRW